MYEEPIGARSIVASNGAAQKLSQNRFLKLLKLLNIPSNTKFPW